ncbi:8516_t:CDS:1, partial [Paraglomus occultum]
DTTLSGLVMQDGYKQPTSTHDSLFGMEPFIRTNISSDNDSAMQTIIN